MSLAGRMSSLLYYIKIWRFYTDLSLEQGSERKPPLVLLNYNPPLPSLPFPRLIFDPPPFLTSNAK